MNLLVERETLTGLLLRSGLGDQEAFTEFYQLTSRRVYGLARRIIVSAEIARDTTQEIYLVVWQDARKYDPTLGNAMTWLMMITHRRAVDKVRSEQAHTNRDALWVTATHSPDYDSVAETVTTRMEAQTVTQCLEKLSPVQREAIDLAYYHCMTYREVAERLSIPLPTLKTRIRDGLKNLRTSLDEA